jgi:hypothetical protein
MKLKCVLPALAGFVILTGCEGVPTPSLLSLEPVAADSDSVPADGLAGAWEEGGRMIVIRRDKNSANKFEVAFLGGGSTLGFEARSFRTAEALLLDLTPAGGDDDDFNIPGHAIARVWLEGNTLRWCFLDSDWFKQQVSTLANRRTESKMLLLSPGVSVRAAVARFGVDDQACGSIVSWSRLQ